MSDAADAPPIAIDVRELSHSYKAHRVLRRVSFTVGQGSIHGFIGPNGAGKTTTLKVLATLLTPHSGRVFCLGHDLIRHPMSVRPRLGFMPDYLAAYRNMSIHELLDFFAAAYGLEPAQRAATIHDVLELTDMVGRQEDPISSLSRGMQQRVSLARVLVHDPAILLLDEPASGLDPRARIELMDILRELRRLGKTIFISSHILAELAELCDAMTILDRGEVRATGPVREILSDHDSDEVVYVMAFEHTPEAALEALRGLSGVHELEWDEETETHHLVTQRGSLTMATVMQTLIEHQAPVRSLRVRDKQLQEVFMELTTGGVREK